MGAWRGSRADSAKQILPITIYNRFNRWSRQGILFEMVEWLTGSGRITATAAIESWTIQEHRSSSGGTGGRSNCRTGPIGRSRHGRTTKIHALTDAKG